MNETHSSSCQYSYFFLRSFPCCFAKMFDCDDFKIKKQEMLADCSIVICSHSFANPVYITSGLINIYKITRLSDTFSLSIEVKWLLVPCPSFSLLEMQCVRFHVVIDTSRSLQQEQVKKSIISIRCWECDKMASPCKRPPSCPLFQSVAPFYWISYWSFYFSSVTFWLSLSPTNQIFTSMHRN